MSTTLRRRIGPPSTQHPRRVFHRRSYLVTRLSCRPPWATISRVRAVHRLALAGALLACRTDPVDTSSPGPPEPEPSAIIAAVRSLVADRGVAHSTERVTVMTSWRSDVTPRGVMIVVPADDARADALTDLATRTLDAGFNHALVDSTEPLAARVAVAAGIANDKSLGARQWYERSDPRQPTLTVLWLDVADRGEALAVLRDRPPYMVQAAIVTTRGNAPLRSELPGDPGPLRVLELPAPHGRPDDAAWAEALRFIADVERDVLGR
jgi:hypothetical protein